MLTKKKTTENERKSVKLTFVSKSLKTQPPKDSVPPQDRPVFCTTRKAARECMRDYVEKFGSTCGFRIYPVSLLFDKSNHPADAKWVVTSKEFRYAEIMQGKSKNVEGEPQTAKECLTTAKQEEAVCKMPSVAVASARSKLKKPTKKQLELLNKAYNESIAAMEKAEMEAKAKIPKQLADAIALAFEKAEFEKIIQRLDTESLSPLELVSGLIEELAKFVANLVRKEKALKTEEIENKVKFAGIAKRVEYENVLSPEKAEETKKRLMKAVRENNEQIKKRQELFNELSPEEKNLVIAAEAKALKELIEKNLANGMVVTLRQLFGAGEAPAPFPAYQQIPYWLRPDFKPVITCHSFVSGASNSTSKPCPKCGDSGIGHHIVSC